MELIFQIEYRTVWGETAVLRLGDRRIPMRYADGGRWSVRLTLPPADELRYAYEIEAAGRCIRREWLPHTLRIPSGIRRMEIDDRWSERGDDAPFHASAFTRGIFARHPAPGTDTPEPEAAGTAAGGCLRLEVLLPTIRPDEVLAVAGNHPALNGWQRIVPLDDRDFPAWHLMLAADTTFEYKLLVADRRTM